MKVPCGLTLLTPAPSTFTACGMLMVRGSKYKPVRLYTCDYGTRLSYFSCCRALFYQANSNAANSKHSAPSHPEVAPITNFPSHPATKRVDLFLAREDQCIMNSDYSHSRGKSVGRNSGLGS